MTSNIQPIVIIIMWTFNEASKKVLVNHGSKYMNEIELAFYLSESFEHTIHICKDYEDIFHYEQQYFNQGYRAYIRPFDTKKEKDIAFLLSKDIPRMVDNIQNFTITFLYKLDSWEKEPYKTFYEGHGI